MESAGFCKLLRLIPAELRYIWQRTGKQLLASPCWSRVIKGELGANSEQSFSGFRVQKHGLIDYACFSTRKELDHLTSHVFNAMLHMDEASPHLHIDFIPFYTKGRVNGLSKGVSMKQALDEMGFRAKGRNENRLVEWERAEKKVMDQILESHGCIREDKHVTHKHMSVDEYKVMVNRKKLEQVLQARLGLSGTQRKTQQELLADLAASQQRVARLEKERRSPYTSFYFSSADKQAFVQEEMKKTGIHFRETDNGFEAPECHAKKIREIERTYKAPSSTIRERLRDDIDTCLYKSGDFEEFIRKLQEAGQEVKCGKYISVKPPYGQRFIRLKSLGDYYDEFSLKKRLKAKGRFEKRLDDAISDAKKQQKPTVPVLQEVRHYIVAVSTGTLPIRRKNHGLPYSWINDSELDKLLRLNTMLNEGMSAESIRQKAEELEAEAKKKSDELEQAEHHLRDYLIMKEKIEMVFEEKKSDVFTIEQARSAVRKTTAKKKTTGYYILNTKTKKIHLDGCRDISAMNAENKKSYTGSYQNLISQGYTPCGHCHPNKYAD